MREMTSTTNPAARAVTSTADSAAPTTTYAVTGMSCAHCEAAVREELEALSSVTSATADAASGTVRVIGAATADEVAAAVEEAGYSVTT